MKKLKSFIFPNRDVMWGDLEIKEGDEVYVIKNVAGNYHGPYKVKAISDEYVHGLHTYGFLALVETHIDDYICAITNTDFIGTDEKELVKRSNPYFK